MKSNHGLRELVILQRRKIMTDNTDYGHCARLHTAAVTFEEKAKESRKLANDELYLLRNNVLHSGYKTGDPLRDVCIAYHGDSSFDQVELALQNYSAIEAACREHVGEFLFVMQASPDPNGADAFHETLYVARISGPAMKFNEENVTQCAYPVDSYVVGHFTSSGAINSRFIDHYHPKMLFNHDFDIRNLNVPILDALEKQLCRGKEPSNGPQSDLGLEGGRPYKYLEMFVGNAAIAECLETLGPSRNQFYKTLFDSLRCHR